MFAWVQVSGGLHFGSAVPQVIVSPGKLLVEHMYRFMDGLNTLYSQTENKFLNVFTYPLQYVCVPLGVRISLVGNHGCRRQTPLGEECGKSVQNMELE